MPIPFSCPHCGNHTVVADQYAGQVGPCSACGQKITIPGPANSPIQYNQGMAGGYAAPPPSSGKNSSGAMIVIIGVIVLGLFLMFGVLAALLLPAVQAARTAARRAQSMNNLRQIGIAMHNYHDTYKCFPAGYIPNDDGTPRTSWRTSILPFVEQQPLHDQYNFGVGWDDPANAFARTAVVPAYVSPNAVNPNSTMTNYMVLTGQGTAFEAGKFARFRDMTDGTSNIAIAIEVFNQNVEWSQPQDIDVDKLDQLFQSDAFANSNGTVQVLMADGAVRMMSVGEALGSLKSMALISDGR